MKKTVMKISDIKPNPNNPSLIINVLTNGTRIQNDTQRETPPTKEDK